VRSSRNSSRSRRLPADGMLHSSEDISNLRGKIWRYYREYGRSFPWRDTDDPYRIFVSELMLQQTQTERVLKKYGPFVETFGSFAELAAAPLTSVLQMWSGLGYNRRALGLKESATIIHTDYRDQVPSETADLLRLPMVGPATAGSLQAFVHNIPSVFIETNIRRVIIHFFFREREEVRDREVMEYTAALLDAENPRHWYYALMDYGVYLKYAVPNPNRKSAHYQRQAPFENSNRQIRGALLSLLLRNGQMSTRQIREELTRFEPNRIEKCLRHLEDEGFLAAEGESYRIK